MLFIDMQAEWSTVEHCSLCVGETRRQQSLNGKRDGPIADKWPLLLPRLEHEKQKLRVKNRPHLVA